MIEKDERELENTCLYCKKKVDFPEATFIFRSKENSTISISEFCSAECLDSFVMSVGEIMLNVEKALLEEISNPNQEKLDKNNMKGGSQNGN